MSLRLARKLEHAAGVGPVGAFVVLNEAPLPLAGRVVNEGMLLYSRDEPRRCRYESLTFRMFTNFDLWARCLDLELIRAHAEGRRSRVETLGAEISEDDAELLRRLG